MPPDPNNPRTARPRLGEAATGVGVGVGMRNGVGEGSSVALGPEDVGDGVNVRDGVRVGRAVADDVGRGDGVGVSSGHVMFGMQGAGVVGSGVGDGVGVADSSGGTLCPTATPLEARTSAIVSGKRTRRIIYISTTRWVSVERTPVRLWIWSRTTSARWRSSGNSQ
jgi:hypothetical protein